MAGGTGGNGTEWSLTVGGTAGSGGGGGGGGFSTGPGGNGGNYGAGGGGTGGTVAGNGSNGLIVFTYNASAAPPTPYLPPQVLLVM